MVLLYELQSKPGDVVNMARTAFEDAIAELDNVCEVSLQVSLVQKIGGGYGR